MVRNEVYVSFRFVVLRVVYVLVIGFFYQRRHFLLALLFLELVTITMVMGVPITFYLLGVTSSPLTLCYLTMRACEASLGLAVLVYLVRFHGNDRLNSLILGSL